MAAAVLGSALLAVLAGVTLALTTPTGARWSLAALAQLVPGELAIGGVDGSIAGGLVLVEVRYESPELAATLARVEFAARLGELLDRRVLIARLAAEDGTVALREAGGAPAEPGGEPPALPAIPEWLVVQSLQLRNVALAGTVDALIAELDASVAGSRIELRTFDARMAGARVAARGHAELRGDATARIDGSWTMPAEGGEPAGDGATRIELGADVELAPSATPWRVHVAWDRLAVQAAGTEWSSTRGRLALTPGTSPIEADVTAELAGTALPAAATLEGSAQLAGDALELQALTVETLGGRIVARGVADLSALAGFAVVEYSMLDPSFIDARVEGNLQGTAVAAFAAEPEIVVGAAGTLGGTLGGRPLDGAVRARMIGRVAHVDRAHVTLEQSAIDVAGRVAGDTLDLAFDARLPEIANWYPPAAGSLSARGSVAGPASDPTIVIELAANDVAVETLPRVDELSLDVGGTLSSHEARVAASGPYGTFGARFEQGWNGGRLAGTVLESQVALARAGTWILTDRAEYGVAGAELELAPLCYAGTEQARLCVAVADDTLRVDADDVPAALAEPWLGGDVRLAGAADLTLTLGWRPTLHGSFMLTQPSLRLLQADPVDAGEPAPADLAAIDGLRVTGTLTQHALEAQLTAALAATGDPFDARLSLAPPAADGMFEATLRARLTNLAVIDALVEDVEGLTGSLTADLRVTGTLDEPSLDGEIAVRSLRATVPALGVELTQGRLEARPTGLDGLEVTAELCSVGCVELDGSLVLGAGSAPWRATAELTGNSFELADLPDLRAVIAPDLLLDASPAAVRVTGDLAIEQGLLAAAAVPRSAVRPAPETVVHGREEERSPEGLPLPLVANIDVRLGDVRFEGLGVSAELDGVLDIEQTAEGELRVNGTASIEEGTFSAYAQELTIERGDLLFTGPSDNPALDVRATREVEGATVGLILTGTLRDPQSEIFSMPALTESEALARLVTGRSLESAGTADAQAIERAALGLGIRRALPALERIGNNLGLDELGVDSGSGEDTALVAGRQLGEDVYLRYKHGLFDDFAGLELIYRITERFRLRTETGTSQSIDLLYERNSREDAPLAETESGFEDTAPQREPD